MFQKIGLNYIQLIIGAILIGFAPILAKLTELPAGWMAVYRLLVSSFVLVFLALGKERFSFKKIFSQGWWWLILPGIFFGFDMFAWHHSIVMSGAGLSTILANTQVFYLVLIGLIVFKESIPKIFYIAVALALVGTVMLVQPAGETVTQGNNYWLGVSLGICTGILYACFMTTLRLTGSKLQGTVAGENTFLRLFWVCLTAGVIALVGEIVVFDSDVVLPKPENFSWVILLALLPQIIGWWLITTSLKTVPISRAGLILLLQPIVATVFGALLFAEPLNVLRVFGGLIALVAIYLGVKSQAAQTNQ